MGIRISKDHLHPSVIESITSLIGDLNQLETSAKGNAVEAINELLANGGNKEELEALIAEIAEGKELIANAVGEPLTAEESFDEMSNDINGLLSTFKTNMMNNGVTVESGDRFKQLIDKIATMVEEGSGKGIQFAEGIVTTSSTLENYILSNTTATSFESDRGYILRCTSLSFKPSFIIITDESDIPCVAATADNCIMLGSTTNYHHIKIPTTANFLNYINMEILDNGFVFAQQKPSHNYKYYAIGVGEEDTTLRDSLADILENKGIDVTEEDDMASLISKVDNEINNIADALVNKGFNIDNGITEAINNTALYVGATSSDADIKITVHERTGVAEATFETTYYTIYTYNATGDVYVEFKGQLSADSSLVTQYVRIYDVTAKKEIAIIEYKGSEYTYKSLTFLAKAGHTYRIQRKNSDDSRTYIHNYYVYEYYNRG
jgi:hypothetical protein